MLTYLLIGVAVQGWIVMERFTRKVTGFEGFKDWTFMTWTVFVGLAAFNIVLWPLALACEIINIKARV